MSGPEHQAPAPDKASPDLAKQTLRAGLAAHQAGRFEEATRHYEATLREDPAHFDATHLLGVIALQTGQAARGVAAIEEAIALNPNVAAPYNNLGRGYLDLGRPQDALASFDKAVALNPDFAEALSNRGSLLKDLGRIDEALADYERAIALKPDFAEAHNNRANALARLKRPAEALESCERAIAARPDYPEAYFNRGNALRELGRLQDALESFRRSVEIRPDYPEGHFHLGNVLRELGRSAEALTAYDRALEIRPGYAEIYNNRGIVLGDLGRQADALASYDRAVTLRPDNADAHNNRGNALRVLKRHREALESYSRALTARPDHEFLFGTWMNTRMKVCDWRAFDFNIGRIREGVLAGERVTPPFPVLALVDDPEIQLGAARIWSAAHRQKTGAPAPAAPPRPPRGDKIRLGYFSADLHNHATAQLMAELFERHDRSRFEVIAFSYGPDVKDAMRARLVKAFDRFETVRGWSDGQIVQRSRELNIDIALDLKGYTQDSRGGLFEGRAAPVQVNYLGFPGTMGADCIDYLIADETLIPESSRRFYAEKIAYLPDSYQINDRHRRIAGHTPTRAEVGLPADAFVFCCFNNNYKITPAGLDSWARILRRVPGSVLWLFQDNADVVDNLRQEAAARGVDPGRLVFAAFMDLPEHLARHALADLFLDTLPCNAHTTASDALWAGLPVLTRIGESLAGRVAASLLNAIGLPELVTDSVRAYEDLAVSLATDPETLAALRAKLAANRLTTPLFDSEALTRNIEALYVAMHERRHAGLEPDHIRLV